jgi:GNAT superfamily N-acetyltransferase
MLAARRRSGAPESRWQRIGGSIHVGLAHTTHVRLALQRSPLDCVASCSHNADHPAAASGRARALRSIERDAGRAFAAIGMSKIATDEPLSVPQLEAFRADGRAWVVADHEDRPVAYLLSAIVDGGAHIEQVSVSPAHARKGLGARLIEHLAQRALAEGRPALTLTTFRDVPWNAPYYRRLGFMTVDADQGPELAALGAHEATSIPGDAPRVAMRRTLKHG